MDHNADTMDQPSRYRLANQVPSILKDGRGTSNQGGTITKSKKNETQKLRKEKRLPNKLHVFTICSFPLEIIAEVFLHYIRSSSPQESPMVFDHKAPLRLGAVCRLWRQIAWRCPALWASLTVTIPKFEKKALLQLELLEEWLARSGSLPLSIGIIHNTVLDDDILQSIYAVINSCSLRWYKICLYDLPAASLTHLRSISNLPLLQHFSLNPPFRAMPCNGRTRMNMCPINFSHTPQLKHLRLSYRDLVYRSQSFQWYSLTDLELDRIRINDCLDALSHSSKLIKLHVGGFLTDGGHPLPTHQIMLKNLERMKIYCAGCSPQVLLDHITLPKARELELFSWNYSPFPAVGLIHLIERSRCPLTKLVLMHPALSEENLLDLLLLIPALESFYIETRKAWNPPLFTDNLWRSLDPNSPSTILPPRLVSLTYDGPQNFTWDVALDATEACCIPTTTASSALRGITRPCLRGVSLYLSESMGPVDLPAGVKQRISQISQAGLRLSIR